MIFIKSTPQKAADSGRLFALSDIFSDKTSTSLVRYFSYQSAVFIQIRNTEQATIATGGRNVVNVNQVCEFVSIV